MAFTGAMKLATKRWFLSLGFDEIEGSGESTITRERSALPELHIL
jgi:hypothetical protein